MRRILFFLIGLQVIGFSGCNQKTNAPVATSNETEEALAFPGAEGFGKYTSGGRGGRVVIVTNLNDSGPGSLREALRLKEPRIVVFAVSGNIDLKSSLDINYGNLTLAGQSAPGDGICIRNYPMKIKGDNVIVRYLRFRMGDKEAHQGDAISATGQKNVIVDHCSMSWGTDEGASFYDNENFTLQWSIISESLNESVHKKGAHGYGGIWGGRGASFHHNLIAHMNSRTPRFSGSSTTENTAGELVDFRNNVLYNWKSNNVYGGEKGRYNLVSNYYKAGPATSKSKRDRIVEPYQPYGRFFVADNIVVSSPEVSENNQLGVDTDHPDSATVASPFEVVEIPQQTAEMAYKLVLAQAGASHQRDQVDDRIVQEVRTGTATYGKNGNGIIDSQEEVGGWPELIEAQTPADYDQDGMADTWETENGLNPALATDASEYTLSRTYTNIEIYLNSLVQPI